MYSQNDGRWDCTKIAKLRLDGSDRYQGRFMIHRDTPVIGGVYLGTGKREAIVVNDSEVLASLYQRAKLKATRNGKLSKSKVLQAVYDITRDAMPRDKDADTIERIIDSWGVRNDKKISLDCFINSKIGLCRHTALLSAALLEKFRDDGYLRGNISVDRNRVGPSGHAWCRYTTHSGKVIIIDAIQGYLGPLEHGMDRWEYARPEDVKYMERRK